MKGDPIIIQHLNKILGNELLACAHVQRLGFKAFSRQGVS